MQITTVGDEIGTSIEEQINTLKQVNLNLLELRKINNKQLWEFSNEELKKFHKRLIENEISVIMIDSPIGKKNLSYKQLENLRLFERYIEIAKIFDAQYIRIFSDIGENIETTKVILKEISNKAKHNNVKVLIENEKDTFAEIPEVCKSIIGESQAIYILYDIENAYNKGYDILKCYENTKEKIKYIHLRDYHKGAKKYTYLGEGTIPIEELLEIIKGENNELVISLETMLPKYNSEKTKLEIFRKAYKSYNDLIKK